MATRPQAVQLRHSHAVRAKRGKVGSVRKLGRRSLLVRGFPDNRRRYVGILPLAEYPEQDLPATHYERGYMT